MRSRLTRKSSLLLAPILLAALAHPADAQYMVVGDPDHDRGKIPVLQNVAPPDVPAAAAAPGCGLWPVMWQGMPLPGGGTLGLDARGTSISVNASGDAAFYSRIDGSLRNQGIFVVDAAGLHPIAIGCGGYLGSGDPGTGCGDPSPIGGTFSGFSQGSALPPSINDQGDVLFLADVAGGSARRGLFLYRKATGSILKLAALGDSSPLGILTAIGNGSLNNHAEVAFLGGGPANERMAILRWKEGALQLVVKPGDAIPGGRVASLVWFGWNAPDGTYVPYGEIPDINDAGAIAFFAMLDGGAGLYVWRDGVPELYVITGQPSPDGGVYFNFYAPILNEAGEIAFVGEYEIDPWTIGWFVGRPGKWRKVVSFYDRLMGGQAWGLAVSHNPQQPLDDDGNLAVWTDIRLDDGTMVQADHIGYADGTIETVAKVGTPSPLGGLLRELHAWPTLESRRSGLGVSLLDAGCYSAYFQSLARPMQVTGLSIGAPDPLSGASAMTWTSQPAPSDGSLVHDVLRGKLLGFHQETQCAADNLAGTAWSEPAEECAADPGDGCWYLVRAEDSCGRGAYGQAATLCEDPCDGGPIAGCPVCGNGRTEGAEVCDGADMPNQTCTSLGFDGGTLACGPDCTLDLSGCANICGNGIVRGSEECDGRNLNGRSCASFGFDGGMLICTPTCTLDRSGCCCTDGTPGCPACPVCGNGVREAPFELCDGADTGGQTCMSQGHLPGTLGCDPTCHAFDYSGCVGY